MTKNILFQKIISVAGMSDCNPIFTPVACREILQIDPEAELMSEPGATHQLSA